jgi:hypothetical protein
VRSGRTSPWRSDREIAETVILGRQVITLMTVALLVAAGLLLNLALGWGLGFHAFAIGTLWVATVELPGRAGPSPRGGAGVREPRHPNPQFPQDSIAAPCPRVDVRARG